MEQFGSISYTLIQVKSLSCSLKCDIYPNHNLYFPILKKDIYDNTFIYNRSMTNDMNFFMRVGLNKFRLNC